MTSVLKNFASMRRMGLNVITACLLFACGFADMFEDAEEAVRVSAALIENLENVDYNESCPYYDACNAPPSDSGGNAIPGWQIDGTVFHDFCTASMEDIRGTIGQGNLTCIVAPNADCTCGKRVQLVGPIDYGTLKVLSDGIRSNERIDELIVCADWSKRHSRSINNEILT